MEQFGLVKMVEWTHQTNVAGGDQVELSQATTMRLEYQGVSFRNVQHGRAPVSERRK